MIDWRDLWDKLRMDINGGGKMGKGSSCFDCEYNHNGRIVELGWSYDCSKGVDNSKMNNGIEDVIKCKQSSPQVGFQIGGYYSHMTIKKDGDCLEWYIKSDGEFPNDKTGISFHICDFEQIENFVKFWRKQIDNNRLIDMESI